MLHLRYVEGAAFKHYPLPMHPAGKAAAAAAWCAGQQGRFWPAHEQLHRHVRSPTLASEIGLDVTRYDTCLAGREPWEHIDSDRLEGEALQIRATPTFFFGYRTSGDTVHVTDVLIGAYPMHAFKQILDRLLAQ
jgi:protein-disulfide isomerase